MSCKPVHFLHSNLVHLNGVFLLFFGPVRFCSVFAVLIEVVVVVMVVVVVFVPV